MIDYGGKMPELQERFCTLLKLCQKVSVFNTSLISTAAAAVIVHTETISKFANSYSVNIFLAIGKAFPTQHKFLYIFTSMTSKVFLVHSFVSLKYTSIFI